MDHAIINVVAAPTNSNDCFMLSSPYFRCPFYSGRILHPSLGAAASLAACWARAFLASPRRPSSPSRADDGVADDERPAVIRCGGGLSGQAVCQRWIGGGPSRRGGRWGRVRQGGP